MTKPIVYEHIGFACETNKGTVFSSVKVDDDYYPIYRKVIMCGKILTVEEYEEAVTEIFNTVYK